MCSIVKDQALYDLLQMIPVEPGTFTMGSPKGEPGRLNNEKQKKVTLSKSFELGRFPVTNMIWSLVMDEPLEGDPLLPKNKVSWFDAAKFCQRLNEQLGSPQAMTQDVNDEWILDLDSPGFRLPTEAEWEFCCRAGTTEARYGPLGDIAWYFKNSGDSAQPVGLKLPNQWGLYDTLGNVWEWCWDWYESSPTQTLDPAGPSLGSFRVLRGGSWGDDARFARAGYRGINDPVYRNFSLGFRLARTVSVEQVT